MKGEKLMFDKYLDRLSEISKIPKEELAVEFREIEKEIKDQLQEEAYKYDQYVDELAKSVAVPRNKLLEEFRNMEEEISDAHVQMYIPNVILNMLKVKYAKAKKPKVIIDYDQEKEKMKLKVKAEMDKKSYEKWKKLLNKLVDKVKNGNSNKEKKTKKKKKIDIVSL